MNCVKCNCDLGTGSSISREGLCANCQNPYMPDPERWTRIMANVDKAMEGWMYAPDELAVGKQQ